jgi:hypothetical protein
MTMRFRIHAFRVQTKVLGEVMDEGSLSSGHGLEPQPFLIVCSCKHTEFALLVC